MFSLVILAGGLATRLRPLTETIPKSLVDVAGEPFIFHQLRALQQAGIKHVVVCISHLGAMIVDAVGDGTAFGLDVQYIEDGPTPLGTGGAIQQALPLLSSDFFVLYGDSFLSIDYAAVAETYVHAKKSALMTVMKNNHRWDKSNVHYHDGVLLAYDKEKPQSDMTYIDYGLGILSKTIFQATDWGSCFDLAEVYHQLSLKGRLAGYEVFERFYEIGSHEGLKETRAYFSTMGHCERSQ